MVKAPATDLPTIPRPACHLPTSWKRGSSDLVPAVWGQMLQTMSCQIGVPLVGDGLPVEEARLLGRVQPGGQGPPFRFSETPSGADLEKPPGQMPP